MLNKTKNIAIISITGFYVMQLCFVFLGTLIENIQQVRHQNQISKTFLAHRREFTLLEWQKFDNKKEFELTDVFYDVVSFKIASDKVIANVIEDNLESQIRITLQSLFNKENNLQNDKKKSFNSYNYLSIIEKNEPDFITFACDSLSKSTSLFFTGKANKIIQNIYRPPC
ncbi:hypothetical protein [Flavobacterium sp. GT3R68]|uniref:hypothetical protein n=1 Tax=Flavobacterium sp. GT3R68 TaxID=2594437 RepID=UPI000F86A40F|nr:hypothetical protein [Flavobacterium sp. GT3R68]RTY95067.1 hypothetical protein EKL32_09120 [Flavobacterium sp. GSN2]TRW91873.1 hypothetical protein FNW07_08295 [Flavobacterium sp. GT3R68]